MNTATQQPRVDAALHCYALAKRRRPGSAQAEAAEVAVLYTLSDRRDAADVDVLVQAALHDGHRRVIRASRSRARVERELAHLCQAGVDTAGARAAAVIETPEHLVLAGELLSELMGCAKELGNPAPRVLAGLLVGETEAETARAVRASRSTVTRTRRALRCRAASAGYLPATA